MSEISEGLVRKKCKPCEGSVGPMPQEQIGHMLKGLSGWEYKDGLVQKTFKFKNYHETMAFVNATAWISHREDHHPDIAVVYNKCVVTYSTHSAGGVTGKDFECAEKIEKLQTL